jgi:hypothetical protein
MFKNNPTMGYVMAVIGVIIYTAFIYWLFTTLL